MLSSAEVPIRAPVKVWRFLAFCLLVAAEFGLVGTVLAADTQPEAASWQSAEERMREMDKNQDGMVTVDELRVYLEARHGKGYEQAVLDRLQRIEGGSCSTAFAQRFY